MICGLLKISSLQCLKTQEHEAIWFLNFSKLCLLTTYSWKQLFVLCKSFTSRFDKVLITKSSAIPFWRSPIPVNFWLFAFFVSKTFLSQFCRDKKFTNIYVSKDIVAIGCKVWIYQKKFSSRTAGPIFQFFLKKIDNKQSTLQTTRLLSRLNSLRKRRFS